MASVKKTLTMRGFKGWVTQRPPALLVEGEAQTADNVEVEKGTIRRRPGWTLIATPSASAITGLHPFYFQTTKHLLAIDGITLRYSTGGAFTTISSSLAPSTPAYGTFATMQDSAYTAINYGADLTQALKKWDGTTFSTSSSPSGGIVSSYGNALWLAGDRGTGNKPSRLYWSGTAGITGPDTWPATNYVDLSPGDGDKITGMGHLINALIVFKERSIHKVVGVQPDNASTSTGSLGVTSLLDQPGCVAPRTVASSENLVWYLGRDGVYVFDGVGPKEVTASIRPFFTTLDPTNYAFANGTLITPTHYVLSVLNNSAVRVMLSIHLLPGGPFITQWTGLPASSLSTFILTGTVGQQLIFGFNDGKVGYGVGNTDNGTAISWLWRSGSLNSIGSNFLIKTIRRGYLRGTVTNYTVTIKLYRDFGTGSATTSVNFTPTASETAINKRFVTALTGRELEIELSGTSTAAAPEITDLTLEHITRYRG